jgi:hypothetical protein
MIGFELAEWSSLGDPQAVDARQIDEFQILFPECRQWSSPVSTARSHPRAERISARPFSLLSILVGVPLLLGVTDLAKAGEVQYGATFTRKGYNEPAN